MQDLRSWTCTCHTSRQGRTLRLHAGCLKRLTCRHCQYLENTSFIYVREGTWHRHGRQHQEPLSKTVKPHLHTICAEVCCHCQRDSCKGGVVWAGHLKKGQEMIKAGLLQGRVMNLLGCSTEWSTVLMATTAWTALIQVWPSVD